MLERILVAVDKSDVAQQAVEEAIALAKPQGSKLRLVHILTDEEPGSPPKLQLFYDGQQYMVQGSVALEQYQREWNRFIDDWWKFLQWHVQSIKVDGLEASCDVLQGRPGRQICQAARDWHADLIVMGSRGLSAPQELLLGSVSHYVSHRAPCSVFVTQPNHLAREAMREAKAARKLPVTML